MVVEVKIQNNRLCDDNGTPVQYTESPNTSGQLEHQYLVMHYTAGGGLDGAVSTLTNPNVQASAHVVIDRDGTVVQLVDFDRIAWHAGKSRWRDIKGLNKCSIGIELVNAGKLTRSGQGWKSWFGRVYDDGEVIEAVHRNETKLCGWHDFPEEQIEAALDVSRALISEYNLLDILGHDDIAPGRKSDPGPAFPMVSFRDSIMGRRDDAEEIFETTANLNIRSGPGAGFEKLRDEPLPKGTRLSLTSSSGNWCEVEVLDSAMAADLNGWVHGDYIRAA